MANMPRVGVGVIVKKGDRILLIRRVNAHGAGTWSTPGGHLDFGESPEVCARRETLEETGIRVERLRFIGITNDLFEEDRLHYITVWMAGVYHSGEETIQEEELSELGWYAWSGLPAPLFLPLQNLLARNSYPGDALSAWLDEGR